MSLATLEEAAYEKQWEAKKAATYAGREHPVWVGGNYPIRLKQKE